MIQALAEYINYILSFFYNLVGDYGIAIIMLSIVVNIILFPLTRKQLESSKKLQEIQPELKRLQEKYKHDKEKYNQVVMEYMREKKINPMGGCLPLLIQLPILIAVFHLLRDPSMISSSVENFNPYFLFFGLDLTQPDPYYILPIMAGAATFFHQRLIITDPKQKMMLYLFPVMIIIISVSFPAGLVLYWFTNSLFSVGNHYLLKISESDKKGTSSAAKKDSKKENGRDKIINRDKIVNEGSERIIQGEEEKANKTPKEKKVKPIDKSVSKNKKKKSKKKGAGKSR